MLCAVLVSLQWQVSCKCAAFEAYSAAIVSNSFGGDVIDMLDMDDVTRFMETMGFATNHKLLLKATFASWKKNPDSAFEALAVAKVSLVACVVVLQCPLFVTDGRHQSCLLVIFLAFATFSHSCFVRTCFSVLHNPTH
jgi:hypothetical protein